MSLNTIIIRNLDIFGDHSCAHKIQRIQTHWMERNLLHDKKRW